MSIPVSEFLEAIVFSNPFQNKVKKYAEKRSGPCVLHSNLRHDCVRTGKPVTRWAVGIDFNFVLKGM